MTTLVTEATLWLNKTAPQLVGRPLIMSCNHRQASVINQNFPMMEVEQGGVEDIDGIPQACQENRLAFGMQEKDMKRKQKRSSSRFESHCGI